jgi:hypothetical protein
MGVKARTTTMQRERNIIQKLNTTAMQSQVATDKTAIGKYVTVDGDLRVKGRGAIHLDNQQ